MFNSRSLIKFGLLVAGALGLIVFSLDLHDAWTFGGYIQKGLSCFLFGASCASLVAGGSMFGYDDGYDDGFTDAYDEAFEAQVEAEFDRHYFPSERETLMRRSETLFPSIVDPWLQTR